MYESPLKGPGPDYPRWSVVKVWLKVERDLTDTVNWQLCLMLSLRCHRNVILQNVVTRCCVSHFMFFILLQGSHCFSFMSISHGTLSLHSLLLWSSAEQIDFEAWKVDEQRHHTTIAELWKVSMVVEEVFRSFAWVKVKMPKLVSSILIL